MKILCIGRNYADHAKELNNPIPAEPVFFGKPDSALLRPNQPFFYPEFSKDIHYECEIVVRIKKIGKHIEEKFAHTYYDDLAVGLDFTARDIQAQCKEKGLPWEKAKAFDGSAVVGTFLPKAEIGSPVTFSLKKNGQTVQVGSSEDMLFSIDQIIAHLSQYYTLKIGDLIYTGTPAGVGPIQIGDELEGFIGKESNFKIRIK